MQNRKHKCTTSSLFIRPPKKNPTIKICTETDDRKDIDLLHLSYCDAGGKLIPPPQRHIDRHGLQYIRDKFDADQFVVCRNYVQMLHLRTAKLKGSLVADCRVAEPSPAKTSSPLREAQSSKISDEDNNEGGTSPDLASPEIENFLSLLTTAQTRAPPNRTLQYPSEAPPLNTGVISEVHGLMSDPVFAGSAATPTNSTDPTRRVSPRDHPSTRRQLATGGPPAKKSRRSRDTVFKERFAKIHNTNGNNMRKKLSDIDPKYYNQRTDTALCHLFNLMGFSPNDEIEKNNEMFDETMDFISSIKARLMTKTKLTPSVSAQDTSDGNDESPTEQSTVAFEKNVQELERKLLARLPRDEYNSVTKLLNEEAGKKKYKSHHMLAKNLPKVHKMQGTYTKKAEDDEEDDTEVICHGAYTDISDCIKLLLQRVKKIVDQVSDLTMDEALKDCFVIYCLDGAVHDNTSRKNSGVITYSLTLGSHALAKKCGVFTSSGKNILPHAQLHAPENTDTIKLVMEKRLEDALCTHQFQELNNCLVYEMEDAKALYAMLHHSGWASTKHPHLRCKCNKGDVFRAGHVCEPINSSMFQDLCKKSEERMANIDQINIDREEMGMPPYDELAHHKWCNIHNYGHTHLHSVPYDFDVDNIRFDTFHGRSGTVKVLLAHIRRLLDNDYDSLSRFSTFLLTLKDWDYYVVDQFISGDTNNRLKGRNTKSFVKHTDDIISMLRSILDDVDVGEFCKCLKAFEKVSKTLSIIFIDDYEEVKELLPDDTMITNESEPQEIVDAVIGEYKEQCRLLFTHGYESFMSTDSSSSETFYLHTLRFYLPHIMEVTYARHKLGPGIFTMEGFEYKNYTSKQVMRTRTNGRGVQCTQSLKTLQMLFAHSHHDVEAELIKRKLN